MAVLKFINHSKKAVKIARRFGWLPGARYTNLRDVKSFDRLGFLDINWKSYCFKKHLSAAASTNPIMTVARDIERMSQLSRVIDQAYELLEFCDNVIVVPKVRSMGNRLTELIPGRFVLGYSVPTRYGGTKIAPECFKARVHLLGGRPDRQRELARMMNVISFDCNRFTLDAAYGDYFDGERFKPHPAGGYDNCLRMSMRNINRIWRDYKKDGGHD
ncbi:DUF6610 family protein [Bremerella sp. JC817]|uniref:DUF6610 family protein n=1 Tax=Bremerella sp. JC817 TaxID=3231756 RepID=UPI00345987D6